EYLDAASYVPLLLTAYIVYGAYQYTQLGILYAKQTRHLAIATAGGAAINVLINYLLIPDLKVWGATIATTVSFSFLLLYSYPIAQRLYHIPYEFKRLAKLAATAGVLYLAAYNVSLNSLYASIFVKLLFVLAFPFVMYAIRFYSEDELAKLDEWRREWRQKLQQMILSADGNQDDK
ncbi:MAG: polysaccharide biosynthesis C-terminal domain-containing protein, partial [Candidatus Zixiibacteriota bacterium]